MSTLLVKNARHLGESVDLLVVDGKVRALNASIEAPADAEVVDAAGKILFPSFIDVHTHLREPGYEWKENVATGLAAAAHGGFGGASCAWRTPIRSMTTPRSRNRFWKPPAARGPTVPASTPSEPPP